MKNFLRIFIFVLIFSISLPNNIVSASNPLKQLFDIATEAYEKEQYEKAMSLYEKALEIYPKLAPAYNYLGLCHRELGTDPNEVLWLFQKAVELNPKYVQAHDNLGKLYYKIGKFDDAIRSCERAVSLAPKYISASLSLAWIYLLAKSEPTKAIEHFESIISVVNMPYAYFGLGMAYFLDNQRSKVLDMITLLKEKKEDTLASQLENMLREKRFIPPKEHFEFFSDTPKGIKIDEVKQDDPYSFFSNALTEQEQKKYKSSLVEIKGLIPESLPLEEDPALNDLSREERIRVLRRRLANIGSSLQ